MSSFHAIFCKCLQCLLFFLAIFSCIFCHFTCFRYVFSSCNLKLSSIMHFFLLCNFLWHIFINQMCVIYISCCFFNQVLVFFLFYTMELFGTCFFYLPCNCFATFFQISKCVSSTFIVVLLDVFGLYLFLQIGELLYFSISLNATNF
jgi:hypothetical protein